jgi:hypothetical protein
MGPVRGQVSCHIAQTLRSALKGLIVEKLRTLLPSISSYRGSVFPFFFFFFLGGGGGGGGESY